MIGGLGSTELLVIFGLIVLLFGANKLPELARSMGTSMGEFKKAQKQSEISVKQMESDVKEDDKEDSKVIQMAQDLGINSQGRTNEELLEEIHKKVQASTTAPSPDASI